ncbi:DUF1003 domain-containing protein [Rathayibacter sp. VKM Ac-2759]|uniref:DUF1003 domain-containing protein n=1 Tax=Rathayibacter sp. VKM Ac-2759 TaxID=2609252 RepID=UPI0032989CAC
MTTDIPHRSARPTPAATWHERLGASLSPGERAADLLRNGMGSWRFVGAFVLFMLLWALANTFWVGWDDYPFILLNLFLSMLAGLQGAILLIAAKRQDAISAALAQHDFDTNLAAKTDIEVLLEINRRQLLLLAELQEALALLGDPAAGIPGSRGAVLQAEAVRT